MISRRINRKAVSPVIAVVLIIALTVSAAAVVWSVTNGLLNNSKAEIVVNEYGVADTNNNERGDLIQLIVKNIGSDGTITSAKVFRDSVEMTSWSLASTVKLQSGEDGMITVATSDIKEEVNNQNDVLIRILTEKSVTDFKVPIPDTLTAIPVFFDVGGDGNGFTQKGLQEQGWVLHEYTSAHGTGTIGIENGEVSFNTNSDMLFYLNNTDYQVKNGIITADFKWGDNDGIGIAFRIIDESNYYWVGYTNDHNAVGSSRFGEDNSYGGPFFRQSGRFEIHKIVNGIDTLLDTNIPNFSIKSGNSTVLQGPYRFAVSFSGNQLSFSAAPSLTSNLQEQFTVSDSSFPNSGYFGVLSTACQNSHLYHITITS